MEDRWQQHTGHFSNKDGGTSTDDWRQSLPTTEGNPLLCPHFLRAAGRRCPLAGVARPHYGVHSSAVLPLLLPSRCGFVKLSHVFIDFRTFKKDLQSERRCRGCGGSSSLRMAAVPKRSITDTSCRKEPEKHFIKEFAERGDEKRAEAQEAHDRQAAKKVCSKEGSKESSKDFNKEGSKKPDENQAPHRSYLCFTNPKADEKRDQATHGKTHDLRESILKGNQENAKCFNKHESKENIQNALKASSPKEKQKEFQNTPKEKSFKSNEHISERNLNLKDKKCREIRNEANKTSTTFCSNNCACGKSGETQSSVNITTAKTHQSCETINYKHNKGNTHNPHHNNPQPPRGGMSTNENEPPHPTGAAADKSNKTEQEVDPHTESHYGQHAADNIADVHQPMWRVSEMNCRRQTHDKDEHKNVYDPTTRIITFIMPPLQAYTSQRSECLKSTGSPFLYLRHAYEPLMKMMVVMMM